MTESIFAPTRADPSEALWMSHLQALSTKPLLTGNPNARIGHNRYERDGYPDSRAGSARSCEQSLAGHSSRSSLKVCQHLIGRAPAQLVACLGEPLASALGAPIQPNFGTFPHVLSSVVGVQDTLGMLLEPVREQPPEASSAIAQPDHCNFLPQQSQSGHSVGCRVRFAGSSSPGVTANRRANRQATSIIVLNEDAFSIAVTDSCSRLPTWGILALRYDIGRDTLFWKVSVYPESISHYPVVVSFSPQEKAPYAPEWTPCLSTAGVIKERIS